MQGGHKPFSYVATSFSPKHYLMCSRFCLVWTLLVLYGKQTDGFAWLYVCVSLNLVTCVFYLMITSIDLKRPRMTLVLPRWDLGIMVEALNKFPYEPLREASLKLDLQREDAGFSV